MARKGYWRALTGILAQGGGGGAASILDQPLGTVGAGIYAGKTLVAGMDFSAATVSSVIASAAAPKNKLWTTRGYSGGGGQRAPATSYLAVMHDVDATYSGWNDSNQGAPITYDNGAPQSITPVADTTATGGTRNALRLHAVRQSTAEQTLLATGVSGQIERGSMAHTFASLWWTAPAMVRTRAAIPTGPLGWHPTVWYVHIPGNTYCYTGSERGFECNGQSNTNAYEDPHSNGTTGANAGTLDLGLTYRTTAPHDWVIDEGIVSAGKLTYFADGTQVNQLTPATNPNAYPSYAIFSSHIFNGAFGASNETYSASSWSAAGAAGANLDILGIQVWVPTGGKCYTPLTTIPDVLCTPGQTISFTLPTTLALWGAAAVTDVLSGFPVEKEEPGNTADGWEGGTPTGRGFPTWLTYTAGTRTFSGTVPTIGAQLSGAINFAVGYCPAGNACVPATFRIVVAPAYVGSTTLTLTNGTPTSFNLYTAWDTGRDFIAGGTVQARKAITATGLPTGLTLGTDGKITGTPTVSGSSTITTTATNNDGQTTSQTIAVTVQAPSAGNPIPVLSSVTSVQYFDATNPAVVTVDPGTGKTTAIASVKSTAGGAYGSTGSVSMVGTTSTGPGYANVTDGNAKSQGALIGTGTEFMQLTDATLSGQPVTLFAVFKPSSVTPTPVTLVDVCNPSGGFNFNRVWIGASSSSGYQVRKADGAGATSTAGTGVPYTTGVHVLVGRSPTGSTVPTFNLDSGANIVGTGTASGPTSPNRITILADNETGVNAKFASGGLLCFGFCVGLLSDADEAALVASLKTSFGTP